MPDKNLLAELNSEHVDLQKRGISDSSDIVTVKIAGDDLPPSAPTGLTLSSVPNGIKLEFLNPSTNSDGTPCVDERWANVYWRASTGVDKDTYDGKATIGATAGTNSTYIDTGITSGTARYYVVTAQDSSSNESDESGEENTTAGTVIPTTSIPDDASGYVFNDTVGTEGVVVGAGMLGIVFKQPDSGWVSFDHYNLWYSVDGGGGFGAWLPITPVNRIGYTHKGLTTTYEYRYKATVVSMDGTESSTPDKAKADDSGYTPNGSDNSAVIAELILAENIISTNEVRGEHFYAQSYLAINDTTFGNDGIQLEYNSGNPRAYVGDGANSYWNFDGTKVTWKATNSELDASGNLTISNASVSGAITITSGSGIASLSDAGALAIADDLDDVGDGTTYSRVLTTDITAGHILLSAATGSLDNIANGTYGKVLTTDITSGHILLSSVTQSASYRTITDANASTWNGKPDDMDEIGSGATYDKVLKTDITSGHILLSATTGDLDDVSNGSTYGKIALTDITSGHITLVSSTAALNINSTTFGQDGIQLQYNGGNPRAYMGNGTTKYFKFDGTDISWKGVNTELTAAGALTCSNIAITGGSLNINSVFTVSAAGAVVASSISCTNLTVGTGSSWGGNAIGTAYIPNLDAGKITTGTLVVGRTEAKCTVAAADETATHTAANISGQGSLATLSAVGASNCNTTIISGGKIITGLLTASNIQTGTLNASLITVSNLSAASITTGTLDFSSVGKTGLSVLNAELFGEITYGKIQSIDLDTVVTGSITSSFVTINGDLNFHPASTWHSIMGCSYVQGGNNTHYLSLGSTSTFSVLLKSGNASLTLGYAGDTTLKSATGGIVLDTADGTIYFNGIGGSDFEITYATITTGGLNYAGGKLTVALPGGYTRYIKLWKV